MWNVQVKLLPVIIGATGTISKSLTQYFSHIPGTAKKTAILDTALILRKVLM